MLFNQSTAAAPLNKYPLWKNIMIAVIMLISLIYALPNVFGEDPALQISGERSTVVDAALQAKVNEALDKAQIPYFDSRIEGTNLQLRLKSLDDQVKAQELVKKALGENYIVALNLAPATPAWLSALGGKPMRLGLDLRGGVHFLMEIDMSSAIEKRENQYVDDFKTDLREADKNGGNTRYVNINRQPKGGVLMNFRAKDTRDNAHTVLRRKYPDLVFTESDSGDLFQLSAGLSEAKLREIRDYAVQQNITTLRNRVNQLGVAEPVIQRQGAERIVVQLPGIQDTAAAKRILNTTASLEFHIVDSDHSVADAERGMVPADSQLFKGQDGRSYLLKKKIILSGDHIINAGTGVDENGLPQVNISLDSAGGSMISAESRHNIGKLLATVFIEYKTETKMVDGKEVRKLVKHEEVIQAATIRSQLGNSFRITGINSQNEASELAQSLRAGALIAPIQIVEERTIGPSMGAENIAKGFNSMVAGLGLTILFMALYYRVFGLIANLALIMNVVVIVAVMSLVPGAVLTLPGIAGIVLTVGMAVDANVLINERIREELRSGKSPQHAIDLGYAEAWATILDSNLTTLIAGFVLYGIGSGPIRGFAVVLCIGILTSMFTAVTGTRAVVNAVYGGRNVKSLSI